MVHGLAANLAFWYFRIVPSIAVKHRVTVYDLRGHGLSTMPLQGYTTRDHSADLLGLLDALNIKRAHLVGHSLGGAICLHFATLHPDRVQSLCLIDCRVHGLQPLRDPNDDVYWGQRRKALEARGIPVADNTPRVVYLMLDELATAGDSTGQSSDSPGLPLVHGMWNSNSRAARHWKKLATTTSFAREIRQDAGLTAEVIRNISTPTLLSYGAESYCLETCNRLQELLPQVRTVLHPGVGHFFPVSTPRLAVEDLLGFLNDSAHDNRRCIDPDDLPSLSVDGDRPPKVRTSRSSGRILKTGSSHD